MSRVEDAAQELRTAHARALGAIETATAGAARSRRETIASAESEFARQEAIVRNLAARDVTENRLRARDTALSVVSDGSDPLDAAEFVEIATLAMPGGPLGVNEEVSAPLVLPLLGRGNIVVEADRDAAQSLVRRIVWEAYRTTAPGQLDVLAFDPLLTSMLSPFSALRAVADDALRVVTRSDELDRSIDGVVQDVQRVADTIRGASPSLVDYRRAVGHPVERFRLIVLLDYPTEVEESTHRRLLALASAGVETGVSFVFVLPASGEHTPDWWGADDVRALGSVLREEQGGLRWAEHPAFDVRAADPGDGLPRLVDDYVARAAAASAPSVPFDRIHAPGSGWGESSANGLRVPLGLSGAAVTEVVLGDDRGQRHNILITGAVGQGKSNLLKVFVHGLASRYSPSELELYLLDFKEGVTLYPMAPRPGEPDFLPHARVLGLESDRHFGLAVLRHIEAEFARRAKLFRPFGDNIARYRAAVPDAEMPRIVVVIDEFHLLFEPNDATAEAAAGLLEAIARRGRSYGVHLVLASQTISGIAALLAREGGIFAQFPIRIALKNSVAESFATLGQGNDAAARLRIRGEAVLNEDYGSAESNRRIVVAAGDDAEFARLRRQWWDEAGAPSSSPLVFDGGRRIRISEAIPALARLRARSIADPSSPAAALIGYPIDVSGVPLSISFDAEPGRNLALLGSGEDAHSPDGGEPLNTAVGVLQSAALSLALEHPAGDARFVAFEGTDAATLGRNGHDVWLGAMANLGYPVERIGRDGIGEFLREAAGELESRAVTDGPTYLLGFGLDRAPALDTPDAFAHRPAEDLQQILRAGPSVRVHVLGWWANAATFRSHVGFGGEGFIDAMLMLRIDQSSVRELLSSPFVTWSVTDNRGLITDRTQLAEPTTIVPFSPMTARDASALARTDWEVE